jgi:CRP-like cAMP-binding protein
MRLKLAVAIVLVAVACGSAGGTVGGGTVGTPLTMSQLKYKVIDAIGVPLFCDPDFYPIARAEGEEASADTYYPQIKADAELYSAIVAHEHLPSGDLDAGQKLTLYRAFKLLRALILTQNGNSYTFEIRVQSQGAQATIELIDGSVRVDGVITVTSRKPSGMPPCPICLAAATLIATPGGDVRVTDIKAGMIVWTASSDGSRIAAPVVEVGIMVVPSGHVMVHLRLADGRELLVSPGHRASDGRPLGSLAVGDELDGSRITLWELVPYAGPRTYDLLPAGPTGTYWANGILLSSTLA